MESLKDQISAEPLGIALEQLAGAGIITQANALVLLRQARVDLFDADQELSTKLRTGQEAFQTRANYYLSRLLPSVIGGVTDADAAKNLFVPAVGMVRQKLLGPRGDPSNDGGADGAALVDTVRNRMTTYRENAKELHRLLAEEATKAEADSKIVSDLVQARISQLDGADGALAKTQAAITQAEAARAQHLNEMVSKARNVGEALKKMGTGFFEIFSGKSDSPPKTPAAAPKPPGDTPKPVAATPSDNTPKPAADAPKPAADAPKPVANAPKPAVAPKPEAGGEGKKDGSFAVEAITVGQEGMEGHIAAEQALIADNRQIALLYHELAEQGQTLAIAKAIGSQIAGYASALRVMAGKSDEYFKRWEGLVSGLEAFRTEISRVATSAAEARELSNSLSNGALASWNRLENHTRPIREAFTGNTNAISAVGPLAS
jgi:hypothetical protein